MDELHVPAWWNCSQWVEAPVELEAVNPHMLKLRVDRNVNPFP